MNGPLVDTNVSLSRWPTRRLRDDETAKLVQTLKSREVVEAWAGSFDALLHKDIAGVNSRLAEECAAQSAVKLVPFGAINPKLPDWEEDLRRCAEIHKMPGIRLHPSYHGYKLDDPEFLRLLQLATERMLIVSLAVSMEDERMMHPLLRVPNVDLAPLKKALEQTPTARILLLNAAKAKRELLSSLIQVGQVFLEIAMLESVNGITNLLKDCPLDRILFGSHAPFFYPEAALLKLQESPLAAMQVRAIAEENAKALIGRRG